MQKGMNLKVNLGDKNVQKSPNPISRSLLQANYTKNRSQSNKRRIDAV